MRHPVLSSALALVAITLAAGCAKKQKPVTTPDAAPAVETAAAPAPEPAPAPAPAPDPDPFAGDLAEVDDYVRRQGLLGDVYFGYDRADLGADTRDRVARNADFMRQRPEFVVTIEGHCDERGTNEYNLALGERRASSVKDYMTSLGVPSARLRTISYGEERPVCTASDESCWSQNRRAHHVLTGRADSR